MRQLAIDKSIPGSVTHLVRRIVAVSAVVSLILPWIAQGGSQSRPLNEDAAVDLLERALKRDGVYAKRISWDCISYGTEETTKSYFEFVLREIHNAKCGGAPETSPVIDRYRVYRASGKITQWKATEDKWSPYKSAKTR